MEKLLRSLMIGHIYEYVYSLSLEELQLLVSLCPCLPGLVCCNLWSYLILLN